jgi:hypothetical protein
MSNNYKNKNEVHKEGTTELRKLGFKIRFSTVHRSLSFHLIYTTQSNKSEFLVTLKKFKKW